MMEKTVYVIWHKRNKEAPEVWIDVLNSPEEAENTLNEFISINSKKEEEYNIRKMTFPVKSMIHENGTLALLRGETLVDMICPYSKGTCSYCCPFFQLNTKSNHDYVFINLTCMEKEKYFEFKKWEFINKFKENGENNV